MTTLCRMFCPNDLQQELIALRISQNKASHLTNSIVASGDGEEIEGEEGENEEEEEEEMEGKGARAKFESGEKQNDRGPAVDPSAFILLE